MLRLYESAEKETTARVRVSELLGAVTQAQAVDLLERPLEQGGAGVEDGEVAVRLPARGIATVLIGLKRQ